VTPDQFFAKFALFADTPNAVAKMRELVLDLAVRGKLVQQNPSEGDASVFLTEINQHNNSLTVSKSTIIQALPGGPFEVPDSWIWVRFGDIMISRDSERIPVSKEERETRARVYDYYGASGVIDKIDGYIFDKTLLLIGEDGANLINRSTPIAFLARGKYWVNNHAHVLDGISEDFLRYIELYINAIDLKPYVTGSAQPKMNQAKMNSIAVPLPPLAEQKRIVAKVDELMALCDQLESQQKQRETKKATLVQAALTRFTDAPTPANLEFLFHKSYAIDPAELRKTILTLAVQGLLVPHDPNDEPVDACLGRIQAVRRSYGTKNFHYVYILERPYDIPDSWLWVRLGNLALTSDSGWSPQCEFEPRRGTDWGVLKVSAVSWGAFKPDENKALPSGMNGRPECEVQPGDFLLSRANTEDLVARSVVVEKTPPKLMMSDKIVRFTFSNDLDKRFLNFANSAVSCPGAAPSQIVTVVQPARSSICELPPRAGIPAQHRRHSALR
jgi:type I restriction enzyme S subunit